MRMKPGECRTTRNGIQYCYTARGVRFVGGRGRRRSSRRRSYRGSGSSGYSGRGRPMRVGECRRTRRGVQYCRTRAGVRFRSG